jgi:NAD-dependent histone deacetylase SIR2
MGTSLATHGVQLLIKDFAKVIHGRGAGKVVFVNLTKPAACWNGVIDYWVEWDCDAWVQHLEGLDPVFRGENRKARQVHNRVLTVDDKSYLPDH